MDWPPGADGVVCGHCHGNDARLNPPDEKHAETVALGRILDCGVENALRYSKRKKCFLTIGDVQTMFQRKDHFRNKFFTAG